MIPDLDIQGAVYQSSGRNPSMNLALEEYLLSSVHEGDSILFLYENTPSVVIGRFQNPWKECRTGLSRRNGIAIRRRISGGGTVVHGPGNLNISVISGTPHPDKKGNLDRIIRALTGLGAEVGTNERYDLVIHKPEGEDGGVFKVSGSAFRQTSRCSMHHATLLVNADLNELRGFLHGPPRDMETRSVASVQSPVANLCDASPGITVSSAARALASEWGAAGGPTPINPSDFEDAPVFKEALHRLVSEDWIWGRTPKFRERIPGLELEIREGRIFKVQFTGDGEPRDSVEADFLIGCSYHGPDILSAAGANAPDWLNELAAIVDGDGSGPGLFFV